MCNYANVTVASESMKWNKRSWETFLPPGNVSIVSLCFFIWNRWRISPCLFPQFTYAIVDFEHPDSQLIKTSLIRVIKVKVWMLPRDKAVTEPLRIALFDKPQWRQSWSKWLHQLNRRYLRKIKCPDSYLTISPVLIVQFKFSQETLGMQNRLDLRGEIYCKAVHIYKHALSSSLPTHEHTPTLLPMLCLSTSKSVIIICDYSAVAAWRAD